MQVTSSDAGLSAKYTNHSVRASCITELLRKGVAPSTVMQISKHRNSASLCSYNQPSEEDKLRTAALLDEPSPKRPAPTVPTTSSDDNKVGPSPVPSRQRRAGDARGKGKGDAFLELHFQ